MLKQNNFMWYYVIFENTEMKSIKWFGIIREAEFWLLNEMAVPPTVRMF